MKPSVLLAADLHWREDNPACREDDFLKALIGKNLFAKEICEKYNIPMIIAGDIFHRWKNSPYLIKTVIESMPDFICIPGQHDLPRHSIELYKQSSLAVLEAAEKAIVILKPGEVVNPSDYWEVEDDWLIVGFPFGTEVKNFRRRKGDNRKAVCLIHDLIIKSKNSFPGAKVQVGHRLLNKFKGYNLIVSGDNHQSFIEEKENRLLINCGSISRQSSEQIDHEPKFYLWYAEDNSYKELKIPIEKNVISTAHNEKQKDKDQRIDDYIDAMSSNYNKQLDFEVNIENHIRENEVQEKTENFVWKWMEK